MDAFSDLLHETLILIATLCLPVLIATTVVGTLIALVQAVTQVQEQTLSLLPKIITVLALVGIFGDFARRLCADVFIHALQLVPAITRG